jgi:hypothetical protein
LGTSPSHSYLKGVLRSLGLAFLIVAAAYYAWSFDIAHASRLPPGKGVEIRATSGRIHIAGARDADTRDDDVHVTIQNVSEESAPAAHVTIDRHRNPILIEISNLPERATAFVEVPRCSNLAVSMLAGELEIRDIEGDKLCLLRSGRMEINVGDPTSYKYVRGFVLAGDVQAPAFDQNKGGLWRRMKWRGPGQSVIDGHVSAGLLVLQ